MDITTFALELMCEAFMNLPDNKKEAFTEDLKNLDGYVGIAILEDAYMILFREVIQRNLAYTYLNDKYGMTVALVLRTVIVDDKYIQ